MMNIVVLGSGTTLPHPVRQPSGLLVQSGGRSILVDTGPGIIHRLPRVGVNFEEIQEIFYTHIHLDHFLDLLSLLFAKRHPGIINGPALTLRGGAGFVDLVTNLRTLFHPWLEPVGYELKVEEYRSPVRIKGLTVRACPLRHHPSSLAYRFEDQRGRSIVISGDTGEDEALEDFAQGASLLILECSFPEGEEVDGHLTPSRAARIACQAGAKKLLLTHFYPVCDGREILDPFRQLFGGEVLLAHDWMHLVVE
jgi:ribonuclease BN (tRNA processing enzyme)